MFKNFFQSLRAVVDPDSDVKKSIILDKYRKLGHDIASLHISNILEIGISDEDLIILDDIGVPNQFVMAELVVLGACAALLALNQHKRSKELIEGFNLFIHKNKSPIDAKILVACKEIENQRGPFMDVLNRNFSPNDIPGKLKSVLPIWFMEIIKIKSNLTKPNKSKFIDDQDLLMLSIKYTKEIFWVIYSAVTHNLENFDKDLLQNS